MMQLPGKKSEKNVKERKKSTPAASGECIEAGKRVKVSDSLW